MIHKNPLRFNQGKVINTDNSSLPNKTFRTRGMLWCCCFSSDSLVMWQNSVHLWRFGSRRQPRRGTGNNNQFVRGSFISNIISQIAKEVLVRAYQIKKKLIHQLVTWGGISG